MSKTYRNKMILNQRGGSIDIDNTTEQEKIKISHRSGSNINLTNVVTSELATNNKQINVVHDSFETVGGDKTEFVAKAKTIRTGESSYELDGFIDQSQLNAIQEWKDIYSAIANSNAQFKIKRGGVGYPNGESTEPSGERSDNPVLNNKPVVVENIFNGYTGIPVRKSTSDEVATFSTVIDRGKTLPASPTQITLNDIEQSAGVNGSNAPGVLEFGAAKHAATEGGEWDDAGIDIGQQILDIQPDLVAIESRMGNGGDKTKFVKRHKIEQVGAVFNDFPSIRIDEKGRSQPFEMLVSATGTFKNHDYVPHIEEVDNATNFPCGNDDKIICNRYSRTVGSGGISLKTTGPTELGGTTLKAGYKRINLNASHGIQIASEAFVELQSLKTITLRTNRQVYVESSLGVKGNVIVGGGLSVEGETYLQHVTAPLEVQQTQDTTTFGKFAANNDRALLIGETLVNGQWFPTYAKASNDLIVSYPHSHHFHNLPLRLMTQNAGVRIIAQREKINDHGNVSQALPQIHERKLSLKFGDPEDG
jgi:hypothetical protein